MLTFGTSRTKLLARLLNSPIGSIVARWSANTISPTTMPKCIRKFDAPNRLLRARASVTSHIVPDMLDSAPQKLVITFIKMKSSSSDGME